MKDKILENEASSLSVAKNSSTLSCSLSPSLSHYISLYPSFSHSNPLPLSHFQTLSPYLLLILTLSIPIFYFSPSTHILSLILTLNINLSISFLPSTSHSNPLPSSSHYCTLLLFLSFSPSPPSFSHFNPLSLSCIISLSF